VASEADDVPSRAARTVPRPRPLKASEPRPTAARVPRANLPSPGPVELTDDQRKL